jgi:hypothetical protein
LEKGIASAIYLGGIDDCPFLLSGKVAVIAKDLYELYALSLMIELLALALIAVEENYY